jgi:K(+)-stimulated pyrophosphate-energized sodium pump
MQLGRGRRRSPLLAGLGILLSIVGVFLVKTSEGADRQLLGACHKGINVSAALIVGRLGRGSGCSASTTLGASGAVVTGLVTGMIIGLGTEYYTSATSYGPTQHRRAAEGRRGHHIIAGIAVGMLSTWIPVTVVAILLAFLFASGFDASQILMASTAWPSPRSACSRRWASPWPPTPTARSPTTPAATPR